MVSDGIKICMLYKFALYAVKLVMLSHVTADACAFLQLDDHNIHDCDTVKCICNAHVSHDFIVVLLWLSVL